jgi:hypothetical protein
MLAAPVFVMPGETSLPKPDLKTPAELVAGPNHVLRSLEVLSPPPRLSATA